MDLNSWEAKRLAVLEACCLNWESTELVLDCLTRLASHACGMPMAMLGLIGSGRVWIKSHHGFAIDQLDCQAGWCTRAIQYREPYIVCNGHSDSLPAGSRFYAGVPLIVCDAPIGVLAVMDPKPRSPLAETELAALTDLAMLAQQEIERRIVSPQDLLKLGGAEIDADAGLSALVWTTDPNGSCTLLDRFPFGSPGDKRKRKGVAFERRTGVPGSADYWVLQQATARYGSTGSLQSFAATSGATSALKLAEHTLQQTREWLDLAQAAAGIGFWNWDIVNDNAECTDQYFRLYGIEPRSRFSYSDWQALVHPEDRRPAPYHQNLSGAGDQYESEFRCIWPDGSIHWVLSKARVQRDESGRITRLIGANIDMSRYREAEQRTKAAELELVTSREQLRQLAAHVENAREDERIRIAREIHDELGQMLSVLKLDLDSIETRYLLHTAEPVAEILRRLGSMRENLSRSIASVRKISAELRPGVLDHLGISAAIAWLVQEFQARTGIDCQISGLPEELPVNAQQSTGVFRILQEILTNIVRHACATIVCVDVEVQQGWFTLRVADNGKGFEPERLSGPEALGLLGMKERARLLAGAIDIDSQPGIGTTLTLRVPTPTGNQEAAKPHIQRVRL